VTLRDIVFESEKILSSAGVDSPRLDAEILVSHALGIGRYRIIIDHLRVLEQEEVSSINALIARRVKREPVAYITGTREFYGLEFIVTPDVLIPRPDTELLVECALACAPPRSSVLDICSGSGAVAIAVKHSRDDLSVTGADISPEAVNIARKNSDKLVGGSVSFLVSDCFESFEGKNFDVITANPPYINPSIRGDLQREIGFEPDIALFSDDEGTVVIRRIVADFSRYLNPGGKLFMEIGYDQGGALLTLCGNAGHPCRILKDLSGNDRVAEVSISAV
jgi:release factor glutamine methyltransferase